MPVESVSITATEPTVPDTFEAYEAQRQESLTPSFAADVEDVEIVDAPEPAGSAPVETEASESSPAATQETEKPKETATEPGTVESQEDKDKDKAKGIPQSRLDEVTKARREAERKLEAETARAADLERKLAEATKPPEVKPTEPAPAETKVEVPTPKPTAPEMPTLEAADGDWDTYQANLAKYQKEAYPEFVEKLNDWKHDQREVARQKESVEKATADAKAKVEADKQASAAVVAQDWQGKIESAKQKYSDWDEVLSRPENQEAGTSSPAMQNAILGYADAGDIIYYLAQHPEESKRIAAVTAHQDGLSAAKYQEILATAHREFISIQNKLQATSDVKPPASATAATAPATTVPTPVAQATATPTPKTPENPKPTTSRAPRPPVPVADNAGAGVKTPSEASDFDTYEKLRRAQLNRR